MEVIMDKNSLRIIITDCFNNGKIVFLTLSDGSLLNLVKMPTFSTNYLFFRIGFKNKDGKDVEEEFYIPYDEIKYLSSGYLENYNFKLEAD